MWVRLMISMMLATTMAGCSLARFQIGPNAQHQSLIREALTASADGDYARAESILKRVSSDTKSELVQGDVFFWECVLNLDRKNPSGDIKKGLEGLKAFPEKYPDHPRLQEAGVIERVAGRLSGFEEDAKRTSRQLHLMEQENKRLSAELEGLKSLHMKMEQMEKSLKGRQ